jgi:hypothetical protein
MAEKLTIKKRLSTNVQYFSKKAENVLKRRMQLEEANGLIKLGTFSNELVWDNMSYIFPSLDKKNQLDFKKGLFLFGMVRKDAANFLKKNPVIKLPKKHPSIEYTKDFTKAFEGQLTATDINHAYWAIAYNLKIISAKTYEKGLDNKLKSVRLAALSTLGASKKYYRIKKGVITSDVVLVGGNEALAKVYTLIRLTCFEYMYQVKRLLKKDFICYKTDCIYYIDSKENKKIVRDFFKSKKLGMKQLEKPK